MSKSSGSATTKPASLKEAVAAADAKRKKPQRPLMDQILESLAPDEANDLLCYMFDKDVSSEVLTDALRSLGFKISASALKEYRRKFLRLVDSLGD